ncbi:hypothetical protein ZWY2020_021057 [Hordeum vulgare]|nr:hypothetical protein ZWY2020_021057 [Hordeum vulgare]
MIPRRHPTSHSNLPIHRLHHRLQWIPVAVAGHGSSCATAAPISHTPPPSVHLARAATAPPPASRATMICPFNPRAPPRNPAPRHHLRRARPSPPHPCGLWCSSINAALGSDDTTGRWSSRRASCCRVPPPSDCRHRASHSPSLSSRAFRLLPVGLHHRSTNDVRRRQIRPFNYAPPGGSQQKAPP